MEYEENTDPDYDDTIQTEFEGKVADPDDNDIPVMALAEEIAGLEPATPPPSSTAFAFELGRPILPLTQEEAHPVVWHGHLKERHSTTRLVQRVPVY